MSTTFVSHKRWSSKHKEIISIIGKLVDGRAVGVNTAKTGSKNEGFKIMYQNVQDIKSRLDLLQIALSEIKQGVALSEHNMAITMRSNAYTLINLILSTTFPGNVHRGMG